MKKVIPFGGKPDLEIVGTATRSGLGTNKALADAGNSWNDGIEQQLLLMQRLLGCTEVEALVSRFFGWCNELNLADGMSYQAVNEGNDLEYGLRRHHSASYALTLDNVDLGRITVCRRDRYNESELLVIEQALGALARCLCSAVKFAKLEQMVTQDPLTGLGNRLSLEEWLERELSRTRRHGSPLSLMMIDVDHFKKINDTLGHLAGDLVLKTIADVFKRSTRGSDLLFRFGGDEFTILLPHTDLQGAKDAARQMCRALAALSDAEFGLDDDTSGLRPGISVGVADYQAGDTQESLLQRADSRLYHAKTEGRGVICSSV